MAHKTLVNGTSYEVIGGRTLVSGTGYDIAIGKTLVGGTGYDVPFVEKDTFTLHVYDPYTNEEATFDYSYEVGMTWGDFIDSKYNTNGIFSIASNGTRINWNGATAWNLELHVPDEFSVNVAPTHTINYFTDDYGLKEYYKEDIEYRVYNSTIF